MARRKCKKCGRESSSSVCSYCSWIEKAKSRYLGSEFSEDEIEHIISYIVLENHQYLNDVVINLNNKTLIEVCCFLNKDIKLRGGNYSTTCLVKCDCCGKEIELTPYRMIRCETNSCSDECRRILTRKSVECECSNCGKIITKTPSQIEKSKSGNTFCSHSCADKYNSEKRKKRVELICKYCGEKYEVTKYQENISSYCSMDCKNKWQSENMRGENNHLYSKVDVECEWCGKIVKKKKSKAKRNQHQFCSRKCSDEWRREVFSQRAEYKEFHRQKAIKQIARGDFKHTLTNPHILINNLLDDMNIRFRNEEIYYKQSIDIYLYDYDIPIEVMGTYWHIDPRFYSKINHVQQAGSPKKDKIKHSYIKNNHGIEILYLWEYDIENNIELCEQMIWDYIKNKKLDEYHSFNYNSEKRITPFMEMTAEEVSNLTDIQVKEKRSMKQLDKWEIYICPICGKKFEGLKSHRDKSESNCCSTECAGKYNSFKNRSEVVCANCGQKFTKKNSDIKRSKTKIFCCDINCRREYNAKLKEE